MSGPKCASYSVEEQALRAARARDQAFRRLEKARAAFDAAHAEAARARAEGIVVNSVPPEMPSIDASTPHADIEAAARSLEEHADAVRSAIAAARLSAAVGAIYARAAAMVAVQVPRSASGRGPAETALASRRSRVEAILARLTESGEESAVAAREGLTRRILETRDDAVADLLLTELGSRVQTANDASRQRRKTVAECEKLMADIEGAAGPDVVALRRELAEVAAGRATLTAAMTERVRAIATRSFAAAVISNALTVLGYEVEQGFDTLFVEGGTAHLQKNGWPEHMVRLRIDRGRPQIDFNVVRIAGGSREASAAQNLSDREMEEAWCQDYARFAQRIGEHGIQWQTVRRVAPGTVPVPIIEGRDAAKRAASTAQCLSQKPLGGPTT